MLLFFNKNNNQKDITMASLPHGTFRRITGILILLDDRSPASIVTSPRYQTAKKINGNKKLAERFPALALFLI